MCNVFKLHKINYKLLIMLSEIFTIENFLCNLETLQDNMCLVMFLNYTK